ncbi:MAG TPA: glucosamine-6-phosphate deaminase [Acidobacteriaceae bacterium]|jgi:glucosamine-6-phosphate deaminase
MEIHVLGSPAELGERAARDIAAILRSGLRQKPNLRVIFAAAPSQSEMLAALLREPGIDWPRVTAFHMDEYIDLPDRAPQRFAAWLERAFFDHVPLAAVHLIQPGSDPEAACRAYASLLIEAAPDLVLLGIGTNGHLAFNDPPADLHDPSLVKIVELDQMCREQQVLDGCFAALDEVPKRAITLTIPALLAGHELFCSVPGRHKAPAVKAMLESPISGACPATALRTHPRCTVYLDRESSLMSQFHEHSENRGV